MIAQSFTKAQIRQAIKTKLAFYFGLTNLTDTDIDNIANACGVKVNKTINDSTSNLYSVDDLSSSPSFTQGMQIRRGTAIAVTGGILNTITFSETFPSGTYSLVVQCYDASRNVIITTQPVALSATQFTLTPSVDGFIDYVAIWSA